RLAARLNSTATPQDSTDVDVAAVREALEHTFSMFKASDAKTALDRLAARLERDATKSRPTWESYEELRIRLQEAERERDNLRYARDMLKGDEGRWADRLHSAEAREKALREALFEWHERVCGCDQPGR